MMMICISCVSKANTNIEFESIYIIAEPVLYSTVLKIGFSLYSTLL